MNYLFEFDGRSILRSNTAGGERIVFAANWHSVHAMTMHQERLLIAADTSIYSMSPDDATFVTVAQHWRGVRLLSSDNQSLLILADGGWYSMNTDDKTHKHLFNFPPQFAIATIWKKPAPTTASVPLTQAQGSGATGVAPAGFLVGQRVACLWGSGSYYMATITESLGYRQYKIRYDDGTLSDTTEEQMIPLLGVIGVKEGIKVMAVWQTQGKLYAGKIGAMSASTAAIHWEDGSSPSQVSWQDIVPYKD